MSGLGELQQHFLQSVRQSHDGRYAIYRNSMNAVLINTLKSTYSIVQQLVGEEYFSALCYRFIAQTPSRSPDLNDYGAELEVFLRDFPPAQSLPYLPDVARYEWAWHRLLFEPSNTPFDPSVLMKLKENELPNLRFQLPKGARLYSSLYPMVDIIHLHNRRGNNQENKMVDLSCGGAQLLLFRESRSRRMAVLSSPEYYLLSKISETLNFEQLSEAYLHQQFTPTFEQTFTHAVSQGWILL